MTPLKKCTKCGEEKPATNEFWYKTSRSCRACNRERTNAASRRWRANHPEQRKRIVKDWKERHPDKVKDIAKKWFQSHKEEINERRKPYLRKYKTTWRAKNKKPGQYVGEYERRSPAAKQKSRERSIGWHNRNCGELSDSYIRIQCKKAYDLEPTKEDIKLRRTVIKLKRLINEKQRTIRSR